MTTCACCGSENTLVKRGTRWHCKLCHNRGAQPAPSEAEILERKTEVRLRPRNAFNQGIKNGGR